MCWADTFIYQVSLIFIKWFRSSNIYSWIIGKDVIKIFGRSAARRPDNLPGIYYSSLGRLLSAEKKSAIGYPKRRIYIGPGYYRPIFDQQNREKPISRKNRPKSQSEIVFPIASKIGKIGKIGKTGNYLKCR